MYSNYTDSELMDKLLLVAIPRRKELEQSKSKLETEIKSDELKGINTKDKKMTLQQVEDDLKGIDAEIRSIKFELRKRKLGIRKSSDQLLKDMFPS